MLLILLSILTADAGSLDLLEVGGSWGTPGATNPTAIWWNPSGIAVGGGTQFLVEGAPVLATINYDRTSPDYGEPVDLDGDGTPDPYDYGGKDTLKFTGAIPFVGVSSNFGIDGLGLGLSLHVPFARGGSEEVPNSSGSYNLIDGNIQSVHTAIAAAYKVQDWLAVGVSGTLVDHTWTATTNVAALNDFQDLAQDFPELVRPTFYDQQFEDPGYSTTLKLGPLKDRALTFGAGITVTPMDMVSIAVGYNHGYEVVNEGNVQFQTGCAPDTDGLTKTAMEGYGLCESTIDGTGSITYRYPSRVNAGIVLRPMPSLRLEAMGGWVGWSAFTDYNIKTFVEPEAVTESLSEEGAEISANLLTQNRQWARDTRNSGWFAIDGKVQANPIFLVGGRVLYDHAAIPDSALSTNNYDANTVAISALAAVGPLGPITIGVSGEQQFLATRTVTDSAFGLRLDPEQRNQDRYYFPSSNGTYSGGITRLGVSVQGSFGGTAD